MISSKCDADTLDITIKQMGIMINVEYFDIRNQYSA